MKNGMIAVAHICTLCMTVGIFCLLGMSGVLSNQTMVCKPVPTCITAGICLIIFVIKGVMKRFMENKAREEAYFHTFEY